MNHVWTRGRPQRACPRRSWRGPRCRSSSSHGRGCSAAARRRATCTSRRPGRPGARPPCGPSTRHRAAPVLAHAEELAAGVLAHGVEPAQVEAAVDVLERVQAKTVQLARVHVPLSPAHELVKDARVVDVHVGAHEVVVVGVLGAVDGAVPVLAVKEEDGLALGAVVPVHAVEARPVPGEVGVGARAAGEGEARPRRDGLRGARDLLAVGAVDLARDDVLAAVRAEALVEHDVRERLDAVCLQRGDGGLVLGAGAVLGGHGALLVELAEVVGVVDAVAHVLAALLGLVGGRQPGLVGGRQPDGGDALVGKVGGLLGDATPVRAVRGQVPGEALEHGSVGHVISFLGHEADGDDWDRLVGRPLPHITRPRRTRARRPRRRRAPRAWAGA